MPRFHVRDTFAIHDKKTFVMVGFVIEGEVMAGLSVKIPFNNSVMMAAEIDRIEHVRRPDGDVVFLCIQYGVPDEVTLWDALNLRHRTLEIAASSKVLAKVNQ